MSLHTDAAGTAPPDAFGPFRVLHQIGAGGSGPVFRAYDPDHDRLVAVKLFRLDLPPEHVHRLVAEFERLIAVDLTHPAIVASIATGMAGVSAYLAQDYVAAESLDITVRQGPVAAVAALRIAGQLAGALDAAAAAGLDHGVLHPRDVLLSGDEAGLTGLGVARALERIGVPTPVRRPYTAPERTVGSAWDRRADVFGLAALLHEMLWARRVAAIGDEAAAALTEIAGGDLARLRVVFGRALAIDPDTRFDTALQFAGALQEAFPAVSSPQSEARLSFDVAASVPSEPATPAERAEEKLPEALRGFLPEPVLVRGDFNLREPEVRRDADVESASSVVYSVVPPVVPPVMDSYRMVSDEALDRERPRSSVAPLAFALVVGAALGFAAGFGVGARGRSEAPGQASMAAATPSASNDGIAATTTGSAREFTEGTVADATTDTTRDVRLRPSPEASAFAEASADRRSSGTGGQPDAQPMVAPRPAGAPRSAASAPIVGSLLVRSTPLGARVFVDGREYGRTPVTVGNLAGGGHSVRVTRDGYATDERQVTITLARRAHSITVRLSPERPVVEAVAASGAQRAPSAAAVGRGTGQLSVDSRPAGAQVFIDGRLVGTTPLSVDEVPVGDHALHLDRDGYQRWSSAIRIVASKRSRVAASLDR